MTLLKRLAVGAVAVLAIFKARSRKPVRAAEVATTTTAVEDVVAANPTLAEAVSAKTRKKRRRANRRSGKFAKTV